MTNEVSLASAAELGKALKGKRRYKTVTLPVSGLTVRIQSLTAGERARYEAAPISPDGKLRTERIADAESRLLVKCIVDENGNRLFSDAQIGELAEWDGADSAYLYRECTQLCGVNLNAIESLAKNSNGTGGDGSPTS